MALEYGRATKNSIPTPAASLAERAEGDLSNNYTLSRAKDTLICFSHLRWDFVFQRPQHLMSRFARERRVVYWEEPILDDAATTPRLNIKSCGRTGVVVATPVLPKALSGVARDEVLRDMLHEFVDPAEEDIIRWYYTPMMLPFSRSLRAACTVYDCMDELANFRFAPSDLVRLERELFLAADVVFTGGFSLYQAKRGRHGNIHPFPSSVDRSHFARARDPAADPPDQAGLAHPRLGFFGVVDERMDLALLAAVADAEPTWNLVIVGPVVKIDPADLPRRSNIAYLGAKSYDELPIYLAGWDVALMPFADNDATRFISPTKTPEYLAGGRPVVSTPIVDVLRHYGDLKGVRVAADASGFVDACREALAMPQGWLEQADGVLAMQSWDETFHRMDNEVAKVIVAARQRAPERMNVPMNLPTVRPSSRRPPFDYLIVGAGFAGSVLAERLARGLGKKVLLIDKRDHVGGNAYDVTDAAGVLTHRYGPHIFHTNSEDIVAYLSRFTRWRPYEHRVLAHIDGAGLVPMPINRTTLNRLYGLTLSTDAEAEAFLKSRAESVAQVRTSEDVVVSHVGRDLYERFFRGYTRKQWGMDPSELDRSVTARVPTRVDTDDRYFTDSFQAMPADGYARLFENMLDHPNITVETGVEFKDVEAEGVFDQLIFTGPVDEYFAHRFGPLPYRSLSFRHVTVDQEWFQPVGTVNYPDEAVPYTRISEYKHITGQTHPKTTVTYEYPSAEGEPYYPIPRAENQALFKRYEALALATPQVRFVGRLATYRYYNMDQVVGQALAAYRRIAGNMGRPTASAPERSAAAAE
jgi:UDP-galactopyranose mutase